MKTYRVKSRNWYGRKWVKALMDVSLIVGCQRGDNYDDGDAKYGIATTNPVLAWSLWAYFMALSKLSGGWTYIVRPGHELSGGSYAHIF